MPKERPWKFCGAYNDIKYLIFDSRIEAHLMKRITIKMCKITDISYLP